MKTPTKAEMAKELAKTKAQLARERRKNAKEERKDEDSEVVVLYA